MKNIYTLILGLFLTTTVFAQKVDYDNDTRWFWGLNIGGTWTKTDVPHRLDLGYGLIVGRQLNFNYTNVFSFDIRGRYLSGLWKGYNTDSTNVGTNPVYSDYTNANKPVYLNFGTRLHELSLELAVHFNNLRANTGLDPYFFGGIGYTWYQTKGDLLDGSGFIYDYDTLSPNPSQSTIHGMTDKKFESNLNGSGFQGKFMPSVGVGLGYQFGKGFSMGIEHKTTFTLADNFDGHQNASGKYKNDWYHYTSLYLRFHIRHHTYVRDTTVTNTPPPPPNTNGLTTNSPPLVNFTNPAVSGSTVNTANYIIKARIQRVPTSANVVFRQNGNYITNFSYNPSTESFEANVTLTPGQNIFELTGTNGVGTASDQTSINYIRETGTPPVVTYVNPSSNPTTVQNPVYNLSASVINVPGKSNIQMTLNGNPVNFDYNISSRLATATLNLVQGSNVVVTTGTNNFGTDSKSTTILYNPAQTIQPPVVYFVNPNVNPYTTNQSGFNIEADVLNVADAQHIVFKQNGSVNANFSFNPSTKRLNSNVVLIPGQNVFEVIGTNQAGSASATTIIIYNRVAPKPPVVTITNPGTNPYETNNAQFNFSATVLNVTQKSQIKVTLNGQNLTNFNYTAANNGVTATLALVQGANVVTVTGTNSDGTDAKQTTIVYKPVQTIQPPVVTFTNPNVNPYSVSSANYTVTVSVVNVTQQSGVNVVVNGVNVTNFTFANQVVTFPVVLIEGANTVSVTGTNTAGTDSKTTTILYRKPVTVQPPIVTFVNPNSNPTTSVTPTYPVVARVQYVQNANQITLKVNGVVSTNFTYVPSTEMMEFTTGLVNGSTFIEITGTNAAGSDTKSTTINYRAPNPAVPPVVTITNPALDPHTTYSPSCPLSATVLNVDNAQQIAVTFNGVPTTAFTYNSTTKVLDLTLTLLLGENNVTITATNTAGTASDTQKIIYKRDEVVVPPVVSFINPPVAGTTVSSAAYQVKGKVLNVASQGQITLKQDGQVVNTSFWSYDPVTFNVIFNTNLNEGNNVFEITGTNLGGSATASTSIVYKKLVAPCLKPTIAFVSPNSSNLEVDNNQLDVKATIAEITTANNVELKLNGNLQSLGTYEATNKSFNKMVTLVEGQNVIEITATNACGTATSNTIIVYKPKAAPCIAPVLTRNLPATNEFSIEAATTVLTVNTANIVNASEMKLQVNGTPTTFNFDAATQTLTANINLNAGVNVIQLQATNACGRASLSWNITRVVCVAPVVNITNSNHAGGSTTTSSEFNLVATVSDVSSEAGINVTHNGQPTAFVFNAQTGALTVSKGLILGSNTFVITGTNTCGTDSKSISVFRKDEVILVPPTIQITNPATTPFNTNIAGQTVSLMTTGVTASSQVSITVNGVATTFTFKATSGAINFNATWVAGANVIVATAVTPSGTASDTKTVIYTVPVTVNPPVITLTNPVGCPATFPNGNVTITGTVQNISNANQVTILYNNVPVEFTSTISNEVLSFSFVIAIANSTKSIPLVINATNLGGTDTKNCTISSSGNGNNGHGNNTDGNDESNPGQGGGGPTGEQGGTVDDENGNGGGKNNSGKVIKKPTVKPGTGTAPRSNSDTIPTTPTTPIRKPTGRP